MSTTIRDVCEFLEQFAPLTLAELWDNTGLLVGRPDAPLHAVMTCLTITPESAAEAIENHAHLIVTHHPLPFHPLKQITSSDPTGQMLLDLIEARVAVYSPHTAFDSAAQGINQALADLLQLNNVAPLTPPVASSESVGAGRRGQLTAPVKLSEVARHMKQQLAIPHLQLVGDPDQEIRDVALACGSAGGFLDHVRSTGCDLFVTGEATFHRALEARAHGIAMLLLGHYYSERFAVERLAGELSQQFPDLQIWASRRERDPYHWL